jgi:hypothetical protein
VFSLTSRLIDVDGRETAAVYLPPYFTSVTPIKTDSNPVFRVAAPGYVGLGFMEVI